MNSLQILLLVLTFVGLVVGIIWGIKRYRHLKYTSIKSRARMPIRKANLGDEVFEDDFRAELPSGGARVVAVRDPEDIKSVNSRIREQAEANRPKLSTRALTRPVQEKLDLENFSRGEDAHIPVLLDPAGGVTKTEPIADTSKQDDQKPAAEQFAFQEVPEADQPDQSDEEYSTDQGYEAEEDDDYEDEDEDEDEDAYESDEVEDNDNDNELEDENEENDESADNDFDDEQADEFDDNEDDIAEELEEGSALSDQDYSGADADEETPDSEEVDEYIPEVEKPDHSILFTAPETTERHYSQDRQKQPASENKPVEAKSAPKANAVPEAKAQPPELTDPAEAESKIERQTEAQDFDEVIIINLMATEQGYEFKGTDLWAALEAQGMHHGHMDIFHFNSGEGSDTIKFSAANVLNPGTFPTQKLEYFYTPGICFFMTMTPGLSNLQVFNKLLSAARGVASKLGGELRDQDRNYLTHQTIEGIRTGMGDFQRKNLQG